MRTLVLFYSYGGNTKSIAQMLQRETDADLAEIETVEPYLGAYDAVVDQAQREINSGFMPKIKPLPVDVVSYDRIVLGTPVWWYTLAPAVKTFLHEYDLSGKIIYPFATNAGWIGHTFQDVSKDSGGAAVKKGLNVRFDGSTLLTGEDDIKTWTLCFDNER